jgi:hypothetical protein
MKGTRALQRVSFPWLAAAVFACAAASGCEGDPIVVGQLRFVQDPQYTIEAGVEKGVTVELQNPASRPLEYRWRASRGKFRDATTRSPLNVYTAPADEGEDIITVEISDGDRVPVPQQLPVTITAKAAQPGGPEPQFAYTFDDGISGWTRNQTSGTAGLTRVAHSTREGVGSVRGALQLVLDLDGRVPEKSSAEVEVDLTRAGGVVSNPMDLRNRTIVLHVKFPPSFPINRDAPHGLQPFVKDNSHGNYYGCYTNIEAVGEWVQVKFRLSSPTDLPCAGNRSLWNQSAGFKTNAITRVGLKIGGNASNAAFHGAAFIDDVMLSR